ncbi:MAG: hypothetical protein WBW33_37545 [Bryobacteraceae bacterium]
MNAEVLLKYFDRTSEAPDAVPRLRQFVLELAVRGKLVDQDPKDEPASKLLQRIHAEKDRRIKEGLMKEQAPLPQVGRNETWFDIPASWCWARLGTITQIVMGQSPPGSTYNKTGEGIPLINGPVEFSEGPFGKTTVNQYTTAPTNICEEGDLLLCVTGVPRQVGRTSPDSGLASVVALLQSAPSLPTGMYDSSSGGYGRPLLPWAGASPSQVSAGNRSKSCQYPFLPSPSNIVSSLRWTS